MDQALQIEILKELMDQLDRGENIDAGRQLRMPTSDYVCTDRAADEWQQFFQNHPQLVGLSSDLPEPGSFFTMDDFGTPLLATRDKSGEFHAFLNACRHRSVRVASEEKGKRTMFTCPFHHWGYSNQGDLINVPDEAHFGDIDKSCNGLIALPAVERDGLLWVHPQPDGKLDIDDLLGELAPELASHELNKLRHAGEKTIDMQLNWKLANDTFGETYHFQKLHKNTLGRIFLGNNLHLKEFGRHHRFVTASNGIHEIRALPESEWKISKATFVLYFLFPNIQMVVNEHSTTLIRIYPDPNNPGRSISRISFYFSAEAMAHAEEEGVPEASPEDAYDPERRSGPPSLAASLEVFRSTIEHEDYVMGEYQQKAAQNGVLKEIVFGRNEPALHHFHNSFREALGETPLEVVD